MGVLRISITGSIMIGIVLMIRKLFLNKLSINFIFYLWGGVIFRLLCPICIPLRLSRNLKTNNNLIIGLQKNLQEIQNKETEIQNLNIFRGKNDILLSVSKIVFLVWILGIVACVIYFLLSYYKNYKMLEDSIPFLKESREIKWIEENNSYRNRKIRVFSSDRIQTPIAYGIINKKIIFPKKMIKLEDISFHCIMLHESRHLFHNDNLWRILMVMCVCIHWFNPFVWIAFHIFNLDLEISCDKYVLSKLTCCAR